MLAAIAGVCNRSVAFTTRETTVAAASRLTRHGHVGGLVVVDQMNGGRRVPVGIVTVDDLLEMLAEELGELARIVAREQSREVAGRK